MNINATIRQIARQELTARQLEVWEWHTIHEYSFREIAQHLDLARTTVTDHYDAANRTLRKYGVRVTPDGTHYHDEEPPWPDSPAPTADNSKPPTTPTSTEPAETTNISKKPPSAMPSPNPETPDAYAASPPSAAE